MYETLINDDNLTSKYTVNPIKKVKFMVQSLAPLEYLNSEMFVPLTNDAIMLLILSTRKIKFTMSIFLFRLLHNSGA